MKIHIIHYTFNARIPFHAMPKEIQILHSQQSVADFYAMELMQDMIDKKIDNIYKVKCFHNN